jgi:hypothetical protein
VRALLLASVLGLGVGCASSAQSNPRTALSAYAHALAEGRPKDAYALLSDDSKRGLTYEAFERMVRDNPAEMKAIAEALSRPSSPPRVTATVTAPNGESLLLVYEDGSWKIDRSAIDLYGQATPEEAIVAFVRAYENKRYDVLMRFVPEKAKRADGASPPLDATRLRQAWEGEQKQEMDRLTRALRAALPTARVELIGDRATLAYGAGGSVELVREDGLWKIEDFR